MNYNVNVPVIVDEMNVMHQLHRVQVHGVPWKYFFKAIENKIKAPVLAHMCCFTGHQDYSEEFLTKRQSFLEGLRKENIQVHEGLSLYITGDSRVVEKGVDVLAALTIYKAAAQGARDIIVCSADSDLIPAIREAQLLGARVHVIVSDYAPAREIAYHADSIISLEEVVSLIDNKFVRWKNDQKPFIHTTSELKNYKAYRKEVAI